MPPTHAIGIDVGGTKMLAGVVKEDGSVVRKLQRPTPHESQDALLDGLVSLVDDLRDETVSCVGLGIPSTIDQREGRAVSSVHIPLADLRVRDWGREAFGLPVAIDNDANAAGIAEWKAGGGRGAQNMIMLTLGTGIGGGIILDGRPYRGAVGAAAEIGHMVLEYDGPPCIGVCTGRGHFEALASGTAAASLARELYGPDADSRTLVAAARGGDERAVEALAGIGRLLGAAIASLANVLNPELVVVGGGFGEALDLMLEPAREILARDGLAPARDLVRIVPAALGEEAGMVGAGLIGFEALEG